MKSRSLHNEIPISLQWYKKKDFFDFFDSNVTTFHEVALTPLFSVTENGETHPPTMRVVIIEQPHRTIHWKNKNL